MITSNEVVRDATAVRQQATIIKATMGEAPAATVAVVSGPVLAAAIEQVLTATTEDPGIAVLGGVRVDVGSGSLVVTATDRYRLSTRTLITTTPLVVAWAATVKGEDLRSCLDDLRRTPRARIDVSDHGMWIRLPLRGDRHCRLLTETFPDYRSMLDALPEATTRVEVSKTILLQSLEENSADRIHLQVSGSDITLRNTLTDTGVHLPARVSGASLEVWFEMTTLYPAISTAIGADVLIDLRGSEQPATIRSADHGDLTTLAMPTMPRHAEEDTTKEHHL